MTILEMIKEANEKFGKNANDLEKLLVIAYNLGKEDGVHEFSDKVNEVFAAQKERAVQCRYHKMAMDIQGDVNYVYSPEYSGGWHEAFGSDDVTVDGGHVKITEWGK